MHSASGIENLVFEQIAKRFEDKGYEFIQEHEVIIPQGELRYIPDFIAKKGSRYIAIEVKNHRTPSGERSLERIKQAIESDKNWEFQVFYAKEVLDPKPLGRVDKSTITKILAEVEDANSRGFTKAAFLLSWGAFESIARSNYSRIFSKPQTPGRIITILSERGELTTEQAQKLRTFAQIRNSLIHGEFGIDIQKSDVEFMIKTISNLKANE